MRPRSCLFKMRLKGSSLKLFLPPKGVFTCGSNTDKLPFFEDSDSEDSVVTEEQNSIELQ